MVEPLVWAIVLEALQAKLDAEEMSQAIAKMNVRKKLLKATVDCLKRGRSGRR